MRLTVLGSGSSGGIPVAQCRCRVCRHWQERLRTSYHLRVSSHSQLLIEACPDIRAQLLKYRIDFNYLFISHHHHDHIEGLNDLRAGLIVDANGYSDSKFKKKTMLVGAGLDEQLTKYTHFDLTETVRQSYRDLVDQKVFAKQVLPAWEAVSLADFSVVLLKVKHVDVPAFGLYIEKGGKSLAYLNDAEVVGKQVLDFLAEKEPDVVIVHTPHFHPDPGKHVGVEDVPSIPGKRILLNHFSHKTGLLQTEMEEQARQMDKRIVVAYDGLALDI